MWIKNNPNTVGAGLLHTQATEWTFKLQGKWLGSSKINNVAVLTLNTLGVGLCSHLEGPTNNAEGTTAHCATSHAGCLLAAEILKRALQKIKMLLCTF